jgi:hypothetical protein
MSFREKYFGFRFLLAGPVLIAIGISQAVFGWIGNSTYQRAIYPILCCIMGSFCLWYWYQTFYKPDADTTDESGSN